jgi:sulfur carrier protein
MSAPPLIIQLNGQQHIFEALTSPAGLVQVIDSLGLKTDRIAVEHNGEIASRPTWAQASVATGDRLEIVHFVGGGTT